MKTQFNARNGLIIIKVRLFGPTGEGEANLALDTGASATVIQNSILTGIGYDLSVLPKNVQMTTGSGVEATSRLAIDKISALGMERSAFSVVAHTLPPSASVAGVLGLDFFRGHVLTLDFQKGEITLT